MCSLGFGKPRSFLRAHRCKGVHSVGNGHMKTETPNVLKCYFQRDASYYPSITSTAKLEVRDDFVAGNKVSSSSFSLVGFSFVHMMFVW